MTDVDLSQFRSPTTIGSEGNIVVVGDGVMPRHAELRRAKNGCGEEVQMVRPLEGEITVERLGQKTRLRAPWPLTDGDFILIGDRRLTFRDLCSRSEFALERRTLPWMQ